MCLKNTQHILHVFAIFTLSFCSHVANRCWSASVDIVVGVDFVVVAVVLGGICVIVVVVSVDVALLALSCELFLC